ncbi:hypothetical protein pipiens_003632 [Culex pipiens pipiens]|uniref:Uncharacterized protein n=1 Tax=Culex pipiens pipiens TaxID=38569 RepID=A0ABD1CV17_CULPP
MVVQFCIEDIDDTLGKAKKRSEINTSGEDNSGAADGQNNGTAHVNPDQTERRDEVGTDGNPPGPSSNFLSSTQSSTNQSGNRGFNMAWNNLLNQNTTPRNPEPSRQPDNLGNDNGDLLNISERLPGYNEHQNGGQGTLVSTEAGQLDSPMVNQPVPTEVKQLEQAAQTEANRQGFLEDQRRDRTEDKQIALEEVLEQGLTTIKAVIRALVKHQVQTEIKKG